MNINNSGKIYFSEFQNIPTFNVSILNQNKWNASKIFLYLILGLPLAFVSSHAFYALIGRIKKYMKPLTKEQHRYWATKILADQGNAKAQYNLGVMYVNGWGVDKNEQEAFKFFKLAAKRGQGEVQFNLGVMYYLGKIVSVNFEKAFKYIRFAAQNGDQNGCYHLGCMYENGIGTTPDRVKAGHYYDLATGNNTSSYSFFDLFCHAWELKKTII